MKKKAKLKQKLLRVAIVLIALFTATIFFVTDNKVNGLAEENITAKLDSISNLGMEIIRGKYEGDWNIKDGKLYIGETLINYNNEVVDAIKEKAGGIANIYLKDERVATSILDKEGNRSIGIKVSPEIAESVLRKSTEYKGIEDVLGEKYVVKYTPIRDYKGQMIGMWSVGVPQGYIDGRGSHIIAMRASIVGFSALCGLLGCIILMLYAKKYLSDISNLKVSFNQSETKSDKTQFRVLKMSLLLICTFIAIWFTIQGFTIGSVVNNLEDSNTKDRLNTSSQLGNMLIDELYEGDYSIQFNNLYKGVARLNNDFTVVDKISSNSEILSTVFMGDTRISTNITKENGTRLVETKASNQIVDTVLNKGKEFIGETSIGDKTFIERYTPIKDKSGKIVGMLSVGVEKKFTVNQIMSLRKAITKISVFAIILAFLVFLLLAIKMVSDIKNYNVSLHTNI